MLGLFKIVFRKGYEDTLLKSDLIFLFACAIKLIFACFMEKFCFFSSSYSEVLATCPA